MQQTYYRGLRTVQALTITSLLYACVGGNNAVPTLAVRDASRTAETTASSAPSTQALVRAVPYGAQDARWPEFQTQDMPGRLLGGMQQPDQQVRAAAANAPTTPASTAQPGPQADTKSAYTWALSPTQAYWQQLSEAQRSSLRTTTGIVDTFNKAPTPAARTALRAWLHAYVTWFGNQPLGIPKAQVQEYMALAAVSPQNEQDQELLRRYLGSFINKISVQEYHANEEAAIEAIATSLPLLSPTIFQGRSKTLIELSELLTQKLERLGKDHLTARDYPAHRHTLEALHQALSMLRGIMDADKWRRKGGLYGRFRRTLTRLQAHAKTAQYYPYQYQLTTLAQSLERLKAQPKLAEQAADALQRIGKGVQGTLKLAKGLRALLSFDLDLDAFQGSAKDWHDAFRKEGVEKKAWYTKVARLGQAAAFVLQDAKALPVFVQTYTQLSGAGTIQDEESFKKVFGKEREDRIACCYGMAQQLVMLGRHTQDVQVRKACQAHLQKLRDAFVHSVLPNAKKKWMGDKKKQADYAMLQRALDEGLAQLKAVGKQPHRQEGVSRAGAVYQAVAQRLALTQQAELAVLVSSITTVVNKAEESRTEASVAEHQKTRTQLSAELKGVEDNLKKHTDAQSQKLLGEFQRLHRALDPITSALRRIERNQGRSLTNDEQGLAKSDQILAKLEEAFKKPERPAEMRGIQTTTQLVAALNERERKHRATLQHYAEAYNTFFAREEVTALRLRHLLEYGDLAAIAPSTQETKAFLQTYVGAWIAKTEQCQNPRKHVDLMQGVQRMMESLDVTAFAGDPTLLTRLAETLIAQLPDSADQYTQHTHPSHTHTLKALSQVMAGIGAVAPDKWTFDDGKGLYPRFNEKIKVIKASQYGPFIYESVLLQHHLKHLRKPLTMYQQGKYSFKGLLGLGQICLGLANVFDWKVDGSQVAEGGKNVWEALQAWELPDYVGRNVSHWIRRLRRARDVSYEDLAQFSYAALGALKDPQTYATTFQESLRLLKAQALRLHDEAKQYALHQAMVTQLTLLASAGVPLERTQAELKQLEHVRNSAKRELQTLLEEAIQAAEPDQTKVKQVLEGMAQVARHTAGAAKEGIQAALDAAWEAAKKHCAPIRAAWQWMEEFQDKYNALKESGLAIWRALRGEQLSQGVSLFALVEADLLAQQQLRKGIACRVVIQQASQSREPLALSLLREIVHTTAQRAPQGFASAAALRMAAHQAAPSQQDQQQLSEILKQQRAAWEEQEKAVRQEKQQLEEELKKYGNSLEKLQQEVLASRKTSNEQREAMLALLRSFSGQQQQATERLSKLVVAKIDEVQEKLDTHHAATLAQMDQVGDSIGAQITRSEQAYKKQLAAVWQQVEAGQLRTQQAIRVALDRQAALFEGRFSTLRQSFEATIRQLTLQRPAASSASPQQDVDYARALRRYRQTLRQSVEIENKNGSEKYKQGVVRIREGAENEAAQDYDDAREEYEEAIDAFEEAVFFFEKALRDVPECLEASDPLFAELKKKLAATQAVVKRLRAHLGQPSAASAGATLLLKLVGN